MASTQLGDIPAARFHIPSVSSYASLASDGANGRLDSLGPFQHNIRVRNVAWQVTGADKTVTTSISSASYRQLSLYNGGTAGTVTATASRIATLVVSASLASFGTRALTVDTTVTVASGAILYFSQETVGAASAGGTVLPAGQFSLAYEVI